MRISCAHYKILFPKNQKTIVISKRCRRGISFAETGVLVATDMGEMVAGEKMSKNITTISLMVLSFLVLASAAADALADRTVQVRIDQETKNCDADPPT